MPPGNRHGGELKAQLPVWRKVSANSQHNRERDTRDLDTPPVLNPPGRTGLWPSGGAARSVRP